jgi:hypothetical protein
VEADLVEHPPEMKDTAHLCGRTAQRKFAHELGHSFLS